MAGLKALTKSLNTDIDWLREHTRLLQRANEWNDGGRPANRLLSGDDVLAAKKWIASRPRDAPEPTSLHLDYVKASEAIELELANIERQRIEEAKQIQADREQALLQAERAQHEQALAVKRLLSRTILGIVVAFVLAAAALAAGVFAWENQIRAEAERERAIKNFAAFRKAVTFGRAVGVMPVFYATDRVSLDGDGQLRYGSDRANRLETGKALVTVPRSTNNARFSPVDLLSAKEDPNKHFTTQDLAPLGQEEFFGDARRWISQSGRDKGHAIVFVPGFNMTFENALYRVANLADDLQFDGPAFVYSWPSTANLTGYSQDRQSAEQSAQNLKAFLSAILKHSGATKISVLAHSLGAIPLLDALQHGTTPPGGRQFEQLIFVAPDVDREKFAETVKRATTHARKITLYISNRDRSIQLATSISGVPVAGGVGPNGPLIVDGIDTIDVSAVGTEIVGLPHSGYVYRNPMMDDIEKLLRSGAPPAKRSQVLQAVATPQGQYWHLTANKPGQHRPRAPRKLQ